GAGVVLLAAAGPRPAPGDAAAVAPGALPGQWRPRGCGDAYAGTRLRAAGGAVVRFVLLAVGVQAADAHPAGAAVPGAHAGTFPRTQRLAASRQRARPGGRRTDDTTGRAFRGGPVVRGVSLAAATMAGDRRAVRRPWSDGRVLPPDVSLGG